MIAVRFWGNILPNRFLPTFFAHPPPLHKQDVRLPLAGGKDHISPDS
jgi:hypothetical protein